MSVAELAAGPIALEPKILVVDPSATASETFDNETVVVHFVKGTYYSLRDSAQVIWRLLAVPRRLDQLIDAVAAAKGNDRSALAPLASFVSTLLAEKLVCEAAPDEAVPFEAADLPPQFDVASLTLEIHNDLADMLAIDPVHNVDVNAGWPHKKADVT